VAGVGRVGVEFDREPLLGPVEVQLEARLDEVGPWLRQARRKDGGEEPPLEPRPREWNRPVERDRLAQPARARVTAGAIEQILDRPEVKEPQLLAVLEHSLREVGTVTANGTGELVEMPQSQAADP
jgi:hypothetical protein